MPISLPHPLRSALVALPLIALLHGCDLGSAKQERAPGLAPSEQSALDYNLFTACTTKGNQGDAKASLGKFIVTTNAWNPNSASSFSQCMKVRQEHATGLINAEIKWDVHTAAGQVLSYPNLSYGWQVGTDQGSTTKKLPAQIGQVDDLKATGRIESICAPGSECTHNTAFELLFSNSATPNTWPPVGELMIWVQATCGSCNAGKLAGTVSIDGVTWDVYKGMVTPPTGTASWTYVAYVAQATTTQIDFNFKNFLKDSVGRGYFKDSDYLAAIELGTEITTGQGVTTISGYTIR